MISPETLNIIGEIDEFKGAWRAPGTLAPERLSALRRVATIESIGSSTRIEGAHLSDKEVEQLLANIEIQSFKTRDEQEVADYADIMEMIFSSWSVLAFTENYIKQLHRDLLGNRARSSLGLHLSDASSIGLICPQRWRRHNRENDALLNVFQFWKFLLDNGIVA